MDRNSILNCDCVTGMKKYIEPGSVDFIIADPPYVISKPSQFATMPDRKKQRTGTDFGYWDQHFDNKDWLMAAFSVLKGSGSIVVFNDIKKITDIILIAQQIGFVYKDVIIWNKTNPMPRNTTRRYVQDIEMAIWFVKPNGKWTFHRIDSPYMSCVKRYPAESGGGVARLHPTQKPLKLFKSIIETHTNVGDLVLDPFMGSGTTAIACMETKRNFIGFEIDKKYYEACQQRIKNGK